MAALVSRQVGRIRLTTFVAMVGVVAMIPGGALVTVDMAVSSSAAATPMLNLTITTSATGTCTNAPPAMPVCQTLAGGDVVTIKGSGFAANALASALECSSDPSQPVVLFLGNYVPVSCSKILLVTTTKTGTLTDAFTVHTGAQGFPPSGTPTCTESGGTPTTTTSTIANCTTSGNGTTDSANYPCPPTTAQQAAGDACVLAIGDIKGERAVGIILFGSETLPTTTTTGGATTSTGATTTTTAATTTTTGSTTTTTTPATTSTATQVSSSSVTLGASGSVTDSVTVQGTPTKGSPTGNVNFYVCQTGPTQALTTGPCPVAGVSHLSTVRLVTGANNSSGASSGSFVPQAGGAWCFSAVYAGDTTHNGSSDNTSASNLDANECVLVTPPMTTEATVISSATADLGPPTTVTDAVTVTGNALGGSPTGIVTFYMCKTGTTQT